jgi:dUTP pyrophosphatase
MIKVEIVAKKGARLPSYETKGAAGMDLRAYLGTPLVLQPMDIYAVPTGISIALPEGYEAQVRARSGMALRHGITMANGVGTIDEDYRGEIKVLLINLGKETYTINDGDRIAQMVVAKYVKIVTEQVAELNDTKRGNQGFGHTGKR